MTDFGEGSGLLERFYELATIGRRAEAIESIGHGLMDGDELTGSRRRGLSLRGRAARQTRPLCIAAINDVGC